LSAKQAPRPTVDIWYKTSNGDMFEVVAVDEQDDAIQIQYLDGSLEELDDDTWLNLEPKVIDPPREALADAYEGDEGEEDYSEVSDLEAGEGEWSSAFDDYE
jgi:hypothetical protein